MKKWLEKVDWIYVIVPLALLGTFWDDCGIYRTMALAE